MKNSKIKITIIDGYLDEPSCLGVPPYISPHVRYLWGALLEAGVQATNLNYITIDELRQNKNEELEKLESLDLVILIAGTTVPGHYLGGQPASAAEIKEIGQKLFYPTKVLAGPITLIKKMKEKFEDDYDLLASEIAALDLYQRLQAKEIAAEQRNEYINQFSLTGAQVVKEHPNYPHIIAELETFRGCPRSSHCAFCSERLKKLTYSRQPEALSNEVKALAAAGIHHYRLGSQTDLLLYGAQKKKEDFILNPAQIRELYQGIRKADPKLQVLHMDNMNPAEIARHPKKAGQYSPYWNNGLGFNPNCHSITGKYSKRNSY